ncbi:MAG: hypothetical protein IT363_07515 [Methanoregulaceae archaeon]|nr:hypothetical protein [Methanoregulaceae archaeon]
MKTQLRSAWLLVAALSASVSVAQSNLLVGSQGATESSVQAAVGDQGKVLGKNDDGFFIVRLTRDTDRGLAIQKLKKANLEFVFNESATQVNRHNLYSLRQHIDYVTARHKVQATGPGYRTTPGYYAALEYYLSTRVGPDGTVDQDLIRRAVAQRDQLPPAYMGDPQGNAPSSSFSYVGPKGLDIPYQQYYGIAPLAGRVAGIGWSKTNPNVIYLATAGGGVWKSTDQGSNWSFRSSGWQYLHTSSVAVDPLNENNVLVGTGDYRGFFGAQTMGIKRSTNGGSTWTTVGAAQFGNNIVTKIVYHPTSTNIVIALTAGADGDIWRSTDGGVTWAATDAPAGNWDDCDFGPVSNGVRQFWAVGGNSTAGGRIARSVNQGGNWTIVADATSTSQSIMDVACSKNTFGKVYVLHPGNNTIFRTTNSGSSWTNLNLSTSGTFPNALGTNSLYNWSQDTYDLHVETALSGNTEFVYCGLITLAVSTDSGATWSDFGRSYQNNSRLHNDQHCFTPHPTNGNIGMAGNDGGVYRILNFPGVLTSVTSMNNNLYNTQFYHMSVHPTNYANYIMGGTQDNASPASKANMNAWKNLYAGDGAWSDYQPSNPAVHITSSQRASVYRYTTDGDLTPDGISPNGGFGSANFIAPLTFAGSSTLLVGANNTAMRWTGGTSWASSTGFGSNARTFAVGTSNTARVYAGTNNGGVWRSDNTGSTWTQIDTTLPNSAIGGIATSWTNSADVIVGINRPTGGLFRCSNTTAATPVWTSVSGTGVLALPETPINAVMRDPYQSSIWYVGTDIGAFMTTDSGATWRNMSNLGLSNVHVNAFAIPANKSYLYVATFGRGIWRIPLTNNTFNSFTTSLSQVYGGSSVSGTLTLASPAPAGTRAILSETSPYASMPTGVTFSTNATSASFVISTSQVFSSNKIAYLYANLMGTTRSVALTIKPYPYVSSFVLAKSYLYGGASTTGTATISAPAPFTGSFTFSENSAFVSVVSPITIGAGQSSKVTTISTTKPATVQSVPITAAYKGTTRVATLVVYPHPVVASLTFTPNPLLGGNYSVCRITLNVPAPITTQIAMQDDSPYIATSTKTMQAGQQVLSFSVYGSNPPQDVNIAVQARVWEDTGQATNATLELLRSELTSIVVNPNPIPGGKLGVATIRINRAQPLKKGIMLFSDNPNVLTVPRSVTLPAGATAVNATVRTFKPAVSTNVVVSATYLSTTVRTTVVVTP